MIPHAAGERTTVADNVLNGLAVPQNGALLDLSSCTSRGPNGQLDLWLTDSSHVVAHRQRVLPQRSGWGLPREGQHRGAQWKPDRRAVADVPWLDLAAGLRRAELLPLVP